MDGRFRLTRLVRTHSSEIYLIWEENNRVGQLDLHFAHDTIHATLILEADLSVASEEELFRLLEVIRPQFALARVTFTGDLEKVYRQGHVSKESPPV